MRKQERERGIECGGEGMLIVERRGPAKSARLLPPTFLDLVVWFGDDVSLFLSQYHCVSVVSFWRGEEDEK